MLRCFAVVALHKGVRWWEDRDRLSSKRSRERKERFPENAQIFSEEGGKFLPKIEGLSRIVYGKDHPEEIGFVLNWLLAVKVVEATSRVIGDLAFLFTAIIVMGISSFFLSLPISSLATLAAGKLAERITIVTWLNKKVLDEVIKIESDEVLQEGKLWYTALAGIEDSSLSPWMQREKAFLEKFQEKAKGIEFPDPDKDKLNRLQEWMKSPQEEFSVP